MNLTKAHVKFLEGRLIEKAKQAKKCILENKTEPSFDRLPEADLADMEAFLDEIELALPVIGIDLLRKPRTINFASESSFVIEQDTVFLLEHASKGIKAQAKEVEGEFVVLAGSTGDLSEGSSFKDKIRTIREQALESGRASKTQRGRFILNDDIAFSSPSAAAVFLFGTSRNGRTDWLVKGKNQTYGSWKDALLESL